MEYYKPPSFVPHKVIRTVDGHNIVLQDLDQDLEQHQVGVVANQVTEATMTSPRIAPNQGTGAATASSGVAANQGTAATMTGNGGNAVFLVPGAQNPKVQMPSMLAGQTSEDDPCFVNSKQYKR